VLQLRAHFNGSKWSVQAYDLTVAPGSGWYEVAALTNEEDARWLKATLILHKVDPIDARAHIGFALTQLESQSIADGFHSGFAAGVKAEKKRLQDSLKGVKGP